AVSVHLSNLLGAFYESKQYSSGNKLAINKLCPTDVLSNFVTIVDLADSLSISELAETPAILLGSL
ncbi:hypothetical protein A1QM_18190, partial [Vibrio genomosp. F10 str. 9ZC157]